ncbi:hypothetical protein SRHO_G00329020 [Serrasalmus rhombeus]
MDFGAAVLLLYANVLVCGSEANMSAALFMITATQRQKNLSSCDSLLDFPYVNIYDFHCDSATNTVTCLSSNKECDMFICECDRVASACFGVAPYNVSNNHLPSSLCKSASGGFSSSALTTVSFALILVLKLTSTA